MEQGQPELHGERRRQHHRGQWRQGQREAAPGGDRQGQDLQADAAAERRARRHRRAAADDAYGLRPPEGAPGPWQVQAGGRAQEDGPVADPEAQPEEEGRQELHAAGRGQAQGPAPRSPAGGEVADAGLHEAPADRGGRRQAGRRGQGGRQGRQPRRPDAEEGGIAAGDQARAARGGAGRREDADGGRRPLPASASAPAGRRGSAARAAAVRSAGGSRSAPPGRRRRVGRRSGSSAVAPRIPTEY
mmetsp:Transcript_24471/g.54127  ORF Transcript_24471/g.54127 Transcript_24471/m.54127 type:complete len:245 (+) Transcript_24471:190-924(+)